MKCDNIDVRNYRCLYSKIVFQAVLDLKSFDSIIRAEAIDFINSDDFILYSEFAGIGHETILKKQKNLLENI